MRPSTWINQGPLLLLHLLLLLTPSQPFGDVGGPESSMDDFSGGFQLGGPGSLRLLPIGRPMSFGPDDQNDAGAGGGGDRGGGGGGGGRSFSNFLNSLLSHNRLDVAPALPMRRRFGLPLPPSLSKLLGFPDLSAKKSDTVIYPFPEDCESELHDQCLGLVRVCSDDGCTLECETASGPPSISNKCKKAHPCSVDMEKYCMIMGDEKQLFKCLLSNKKNLSALCLTSEPCLKSETSKECKHGGVGKHIFERVMDRAGGEHGEIHPENPACSCKKHFLGFSGCGSHMTHPFCLPCGPNCIRNPFCGPSSTWCEVENSRLCPPGGTIKTFEFKLNQIDGNEKYKKKFPTSMLKTIYRSCMSKKHVGLGSWLKDIMEPIEAKVADQLEGTLARANSIRTKNQTVGATKSTVGNVVKKDGEMFKFSADASETGGKKKVVMPDIVPETELTKARAAVDAAWEAGDHKAKTATTATTAATAATAESSKETSNSATKAETELAKARAAVDAAWAADHHSTSKIQQAQPQSSSSTQVAASTTGGHRGKFITWLWCGIGVAVVGTIVVVYLRQTGSSQRGPRRRQRNSSNEKISRQVGDEFL